MSLRWAVKWDAKIMWDNCLPLLFTTRAKARKYIDEYYGYIKVRPDLHRPPHNWRMPKAVQVKVNLEEV